eukprot:6393067-Pyramimonas_sp.AAC.1
MSYTTNLSSCMVVFLAVVGQHWTNGSHPLVEDALRNVISLLSTAEVLRVRNRRIELNAAPADQIPAGMEVGGGSCKLEVVHAYREYEARFLASPHAFPT